MADQLQPPEGLRGTHELEIIRDEQRGRGWYLAWRCERKGCDAAGNMTIPRREKALELFSLIADAHRQLAVSSTGEEGTDRG